MQEKSELEPQLDVAKTSLHGDEENLAATELKISDLISQNKSLQKVSKERLEQIKRRKVKIWKLRRTNNFGY